MNTVRNLVRKGLRVKGHKAHPEVRQSMIKFAKWLRTQFVFPIRVPVYLSPKTQIRSNGILVSASFFAPDCKDVEPFIRIATGDYKSLKKKRGRNNALASVLCSLAHEVIHYQQWYSGAPLSESEAIRG